MFSFSFVSHRVSLGRLPHHLSAWVWVDLFIRFLNNIVFRGGVVSPMPTPSYPGGPMIFCRGCRPHCSQTYFQLECVGCWSQTRDSRLSKAQKKTIKVNCKLLGHYLYLFESRIESSWNDMAHGDAWEGKWRGYWQMEWVASTLQTTSEHGVSSITTADTHTSAASSRMNWRPYRLKWNRPFRRKTKSGFCACAVTFKLASNNRSKGG